MSNFSYRICIIKSVVIEVCLIESVLAMIRPQPYLSATEDDLFDLWFGRSYTAFASGSKGLRKKINHLKNRKST